MGQPGEDVQKAGTRVWISAKGTGPYVLVILFFAIIKDQNYVRRQIQWRNERLYNSPRLLLKYFLIAGEETFEDFILSNPDTYLYNRQLEARAKERRHL